MAGDDSAAVVEHLAAVEALLSTPGVEQLTRAAGTAGKRAVVSVGGRLGRLSHMGRKGVKLGGRYDVAGSAVAVALRPPGAWVIVERGAKPHRIAPKRSRLRAARGGRPPALGGGLDQPRAHVVGRAKGRGGIRQAFAAARPAMTDAVRDAQVEAMRRIYGIG
jgi:hypothetical protein